MANVSERLRSAIAEPANTRVGIPAWETEGVFHEFPISPDFSEHHLALPEFGLPSLQVSNPWVPRRVDATEVAHLPDIETTTSATPKTSANVFVETFFCSTVESQAGANA